MGTFLNDYGYLMLFFFFFQAFVAIGDSNGHIGLGVKCSKEVATAIRGAIILAKLSVVPVRRGYWGNKIGKPHTVPCKVRFLPRIELKVLYIHDVNFTLVMKKK